MELRFTSEFADAIKAQRLAFEAYLDDSDVAGADSRNAADNAAVQSLLFMPAGTVGGLQAKLDLIEDRGMMGWSSWPMYRPAVARDLVELRRPAATLHAAFAKWRVAREAHELCEEADEVASVLRKAEGDAQEALFAAPCCSPGDFLVKTYVGIIGENGSGRRRNNESMWDIDIAKADHPTHIDAAWQRTAYHDLDMCDLGACLLAFGRLEFSAGEWVARAAAIGLGLRLALADDGERLDLVVSTQGAECSDRIARERDRLRRILAFDPTRRTAAIKSEIVFRWPQFADWRSEPLLDADASPGRGD